MRSDFTPPRSAIHAGSRRRRVLLPSVATLLAATALLGTGCRREQVAPPAPQWRTYGKYYCAEGNESLAREFAERLRKEGMEAEVFRVGEVPLDRVSPVFHDRVDGWFVLVPPERERDTHRIWDSLLDERGATSPPPPPPLEPFPLGAARPVPAEVADAIRTELATRRERDQEVRKDPARRAEMPEVDSDNTAWLRRTVGEWGWIDTERFGAPAAGAAFLLVQHSGDLPLMLAALPEIEREVHAGRLDGQDFALLFDRLQVMQERPQRYGTQIIEDPNGEGWIVAPLEDPAGVDARRAGLGLEPLADYLERFEMEVRPPR